MSEYQYYDFCAIDRPLIVKLVVVIAARVEMERSAAISFFVITAVLEQGERWRNDRMRRFLCTDLQQPSDVPFRSERRRVGNLLGSAPMRVRRREPGS